VDGRIILKLNLAVVRCDNLDCTDVVQHSDQWWTSVHGIELLSVA
jgi:hypothetical protein